MAINYDTAPSGGIDQQVQDKADTYRKNPQGLFGKYRASGDLIDLIALQRLNEERKAKQQEIAMQMEQNPQSVAAQEYEQAKGLIKDDIVGQTGKLLQEKQKRAAMNQQRMMGGQPPTGVPAAARRRPPTNMAGIGGVPPRAPVNPRGTGIAANPVPSSPTAYGAGGGIVSFQNTGSVKITEAQLREMGIDQKTWDSLTQGTKDTILDSFDPAHPPAYSRNIAPMERTRALRAEADNIISARPNWLSQFQEWRGGSEEGLADIVSQREAAQDRADILRGIAKGDLNQWDVEEVDDTTAAATTTGGPTPLSLQQAQNAAQVKIDPNIARQHAFFAGQTASNQPLVEDQFTGVPPTVTTQGMLRDYVDRSGTNYADKPFVPTPDFPVESEDATTVSAYTIDQADPERAKLLRDKRGTLQTDVEGIAGQDIAQAWKDKVTAGENVFGREGVAGKFDSMVNERRNLYDAEGASRANSRVWDILARTRGQGAFADAGRAASDMREADRQRRVMELADVQGLQERGIAQDYSMANAILTSADKTETNVTNAIANANAVRESILNSESSELTDLAKNMMDADIQNMEQEDRVLQRKFDAMISKYGQQVTQRGQNLTAQLANERNAIAALNVVAMTEIERDKLIVKIEDLVRKISTDYTVVAQDAINALKIEEVYTKAEPADQQRMEDEITEEYGKLADIIAEQFRNALEEVWGAGYKVSK